MNVRLLLTMLSTGLLLAACQADIFPGTDQPSPGDDAEPGTPEDNPEESAQPPEPPEHHRSAPHIPDATFSDAITAPVPEPGARSGLWSAYPLGPDDQFLERGNFFVEEVTLLPIAGQPGEVKLWIEGYLPTPCNQPRALVIPPDAQNRIVVELYSVMPRDVMCAQVIKPFAGQVATLSDLPSGEYSIVIEDLEPQALVVP